MAHDREGRDQDHDADDDQARDQAGGPSNVLRSTRSAEYAPASVDGGAKSRDLQQHLRRRRDLRDPHQGIAGVPRLVPASSAVAGSPSSTLPAHSLA